MNKSNTKGTPVKALVKKNLEKSITEKVKHIFNTSLTHPMVRASISWSIVADQLETLLGHEIYKQWFKDSRPLVVTDNVLIVQTKNNFAAQWINNHYHELIQTLIKAQDKKLSCYFVAPIKN